MIKIDFEKLMGQEAYAKHLAGTAEIQRLYNLPDRWLARELVNLSRHVIDTCEMHEIQLYDASTYLLFDCIPEIAYRLGETNFRARERTSELRGVDAVSLREALSQSMNWNSSIHGLMNANLIRGFNPYSLLTNEPCNGNPVVFGLDRVAMPVQNDPDKIARDIYDIALRRGHDPDYVWCPEFNLESAHPIASSYMGM